MDSSRFTPARAEGFLSTMPGVVLLFADIFHGRMHKGNDYKPGSFVLGHADSPQAALYLPSLHTDTGHFCSDWLRATVTMR